LLYRIIDSLAGRPGPAADHVSVHVHGVRPHDLTELGLGSTGAHYPQG
jgi:hypothetical protein